MYWGFMGIRTDAARRLDDADAYDQVIRVLTYPGRFTLSNVRLTFNVQPGTVVPPGLHSSADLPAIGLLDDAARDFLIKHMLEVLAEARLASSTRLEAAQQAFDALPRAIRPVV